MKLRRRKKRVVVCESERRGTAGSAFKRNRSIFGMEVQENSKAVEKKTKETTSVGKDIAENQVLGSDGSATDLQGGHDEELWQVETAAMKSKRSRLQAALQKVDKQIQNREETLEKIRRKLLPPGTSLSVARTDRKKDNERRSLERSKKKKAKRNDAVDETSVGLEKKNKRKRSDEDER